MDDERLGTGQALEVAFEAIKAMHQNLLAMLATPRKAIRCSWNWLTSSTSAVGPNDPGGRSAGEPQSGAGGPAGRGQIQILYALNRRFSG